MQIQQVAKELSVHPDTIRRWERLGIIPQVRRDSDGLRNFSDRDVQWLKCAKVLNQFGVSTDFQREYTHLVMLGKKAAPARHTFLKEQLVQMQNDHQSVISAIDQMEKLDEQK